MFFREDEIFDVGEGIGDGEAADFSDVEHRAVIAGAADDRAAECAGSVGFVRAGKLNPKTLISSLDCGYDFRLHFLKFGIAYDSRIQQTFGTFDFF